MATIVFGGGAKAFSGNSVLNGCRIVNPGASDDVALDWNQYVTDANTQSAEE